MESATKPVAIKINGIFLTYEFMFLKRANKVIEFAPTMKKTKVTIITVGTTILNRLLRSLW